MTLNTIKMVISIYHLKRLYMKTNLRKHNLIEIFSQSAKNYADNFGWLDDLIVTSEKGLIYMTEQMSELLKDNQEYLKDYIKRETSILKTPEYFSTAYSSLNDEMEGLDRYFSSISINSSSSSNSFISMEFSKKKSKIFDFDHEVGHLVAEMPYNIKTQNQKESIADVFAILMHVKRFGNQDLKLFDNVAYNYSNYLILSDDAGYYTSKSIFAAKKFAEEIDIEKLSLNQIKICATQIGSSFALSENKLEKINKTYKKVGEIFDEEKSTKREYLQEIAKTMLAHKNDEDIYRAGKLFLESQKTSIVIEKLRKTNSFWSKALTEMKKHEEETNFCLNPIKSKYSKYRKKQLTSLINKKTLPSLRFSA